MRQILIFIKINIDSIRYKKSQINLNSRLKKINSFIFINRSRLIIEKRLIMWI